MSPFALRILAATSASCALVWLIYELAWIPLQYDLESAEIESRLAVQTVALEQRFESLAPEEWDRAVAALNRESDELYSLVRESDPDWIDLVSRVRSEGQDGRLVDGYDSLGALVLPDDKTLLRIEVFYLEADGSFDLAFWVFLAAGIGLGVVLLKPVLAAQERRIGALTEAIRRFQQDQRRARVPVRGRDQLGELEQRVDGLIGHLDGAIGDLHESIGAQRDLMHAVAHEFRGPIARLRFAGDLVEDTQDPEERGRLLASIDTAVGELEDLVREVLGYSRIRDGGYRLDWESVALSAVIEEVATKVRAEYPAVEFVLATDPDEVEVDSRMLERAVINLARNAGRFAQSRVEISARVAGTQFEVRVGDDGPGIAPGKRERIFEPFTRLDASRSRGSGGSGLGLAIAMAISRQHEGDIQCLDSPLGGAEFRLIWPCRRHPHAAVTSP